MPHSRRSFIHTFLIGSSISTVALASGKLLPTPSETEGPFYPDYRLEDKDHDLTQVKGRKEKAKGKAIWVHGTILDTDGKRLANAKVDLWQANASGRYRHRYDSSTGVLDPNFQGWAILKSDERGEFKLKTIMPGAYPAGRGWSRPPHIHYKVSHGGFSPLTTQMYFEGQKLNDKDYLLQGMSKAERQSLIAKRLEGEEESYAFNIVLRNA